MLPFDCSCRTVHIKFCCIQSNGKQLDRLLHMQLYNIGAGYCYNGKLKYKVKGKRFSGDMNTALGNCIIMCGMVYEYCQARRIPEFQLINNGDDCVVFIERQHLGRFSSSLDQWFLELGFRMTVEPPVYSLAKIEFCQMHPIRIRDDIIMVRNIPTSTAKDTLSTIDIRNPRTRAKWLTAVGECGLAVTGGIPIVAEFYKAYMRWGGNTPSKLRDSPQFQSSGFMHLSKGVATIDEPPLDITRVDVFEAWNITPDEQIALEGIYRNIVWDDTITDRYDNPHTYLLL
nr:MAG: RNA-dependent RNA polymerase [Riboviria sp.]